MTLVRRTPILFLAIVLLAIGAAGAFHAPAMAQEEQQDRGWSLRDLLFPRRGITPRGPHVGADPAVFIAYGVTSVRDPGSTLVSVRTLQDREAWTAEPAPRLFTSGEIL